MALNYNIDDPTIRIDNATIRIDGAFVDTGALVVTVTRASPIKTTPSVAAVMRVTGTGSGPRGFSR